MSDVVNLDRQGIPTVLVATKKFEYSARLQAKMRGLTDLPIVVIPHNSPADFTPEVEGPRAAASIEAIVAALTGGEPVPVKEA